MSLPFPPNAVPTLQFPQHQDPEDDQISQCKETFRPKFMLKIFCYHWLVSTAIAITSVVLSLGQFDTECKVYFLIIYLQVGLWVGTFELRQLIKPTCHKMERTNPQLWQKLSIFRQRPIQIVTLWSTVLIAVQQYAAQFLNVKDNTDNCQSPGSPPQMIVVIFSCLQAVALSVFYITAIPELCKCIREYSRVAVADLSPELPGQGITGATISPTDPDGDQYVEAPELIDISAPDSEEYEMDDEMNDEMEEESEEEEMEEESEEEEMEEEDELIDIHNQCDIVSIKKQMEDCANELQALIVENEKLRRIGEKLGIIECL